MSYNPIDNIKSLSRLKNLSYINLSYTNTEDIRPLEILTRLKQSHNLDSWIYEINLSNTRVINLKPLSYFDRLDRLDLSHNTITDITPITNIEMLSLNLANNQLNTLQQLENLTVALVLDLRNNPINLKECPILPNTSGTSLFKISHLGDFQCYFD